MSCGRLRKREAGLRGFLQGKFMCRDFARSHLTRWWRRQAATRSIRLDAFAEFAAPGADRGRVISACRRDAVRLTLSGRTYLRSVLRRIVFAHDARRRDLNAETGIAKVASACI